ncbi:MAG TPA: VWA domain-containing protein [Vicinamibacterales bacterium]|nr:VWA domain-containing protein [Vicinamibacterales bacterium]
MPARRSILAAAAACLLPVGSADGQERPAQTTEPAPKFRSSVDLVSIAAVVRDRKGRFVSDLSRDDFIVVEAGERKELVGFETEENGPVRIAVLVDISGSMRVGSKAVDAGQAARHLFSALKPGDKAALFSFDTRLDHVHAFTSEFARLEAALERVEPPFGQTSLYDAIAETAQVVADEASSEGRLPQRAAVVVLTDGVDTKSRLTPSEVSGIASSIDVPVYVIAVMSVIDDPSRVEKDRQPEMPSSRLRDLARWTGGELFTAVAPAHASIAARQLVDELRHQYLLAFESSTGSGWRPLEIRARQRNLVVRARSGYIVSGRTRPVQER